MNGIFPEMNILSSWMFAITNFTVRVADNRKSAIHTLGSLLLFHGHDEIVWPWGHWRVEPSLV